MESESSLLLPTLVAGVVFVVVLLRSVFGGGSVSPGRSHGPGASVEELVRSGRKIDAIKAYRANHPESSLKQAKDAVEEIERSL